MASDYSNVNSATVQLVNQQGLPVYAQSNKIYPKRMAGTFRNLKWWTASLWLSFFLGPYLRWQGQQAILLDIPARKFHFFNLVYRCLSTLD